MVHPFSLDHETAVITGGGSGLGMARCFRKAGARVILVGRRREELAKACDELGEHAFFVVQDITDLDGIEAAFKELVSLHGPPTILINNAGTHLKKPVVDTRPDEFEGVLRTHLTAAHNLTRLVLPGMLERGHGNILFIIDRCGKLS